LSLLQSIYLVELWYMCGDARLINSILPQEQDE
jgi:hypothetical protein